MLAAILDERKLRAWRAARQGLDGSLAGKSPSQVLSRSGWARSVGGAGPSLSLFSRAGTTRAEADRAVADLPEFRAFETPRDPHYALVAGIDATNQLRRDVTLLTDPAHRIHPLLVAPGRGAGFVVDLPDHAILDRGQLVGLWEYDTETRKIVWTTFDQPSAGLAEAVAHTEAFVRDQLGDARAFSLDSPRSRDPRIEALRIVSPPNVPRSPGRSQS